MTIYYFDASALVKYYIVEPGSTWVRGLIGAPVNSVFISEASITESAAAFAVLYRTQRISRRARIGAYNACMNDIANGSLKPIPVTTPDFHQAAELTQRHPLKAYDAVQLAVALRYSQRLTNHQLTVTFVSGDNTLLAAAQAEALITDNPFSHISADDTPA